MRTNRKSKTEKINVSKMWGRKGLRRIEGSSECWLSTSGMRSTHSGYLGERLISPITYGFFASSHLSFCLGFFFHKVILCWRVKLTIYFYFLLKFSMYFDSLFHVYETTGHWSYDVCLFTLQPNFSKGRN